ncbi:L domain-like protein [Rhizoclosmatium globosum]|uniref:L domain-like protein n=1 Tax=Rhizoclosmatium globosum TaxID=329046 RepID=A0A1Y2BBL0_9FUNG|nr:L domain-like protein [Rhizoclosmatium globosum]|eukprot:ORY32213.1 L domain-like protein [Rhizoclosmatium globosum]
MPQTPDPSTASAVVNRKPMMSLPFDVLVMILGWLRPSEAFKVAHVSKDFKALIYSAGYATSVINTFLKEDDSSDRNELYYFRKAFFLAPSAAFQQVFALKQAQLTTELYFGWFTHPSEIPDALGQFRCLQTLDIVKCHVLGSIPTSLSNLTQLKSLNIGECDTLSGPIPVELGMLTQLERLSLHSNKQLNGPLHPEWGTQLLQLQRLDLSGTAVTGPIPREWGNMQNLQMLFLAGTLMNGPIPRELGRLRKLRFLNLYDSHTTGLIPREIKRIRKLNLNVDENPGIEGYEE